MASLRHAIKIAAPQTRVYRAITEIDQIKAWHDGAVEGGTAPGEVLRLTPKPGLEFAWRTESRKPESELVQKCIEGPGNSTVKTVRFALSGTDDGRTLVSLTDGDWSESDPHFAFCNTRWGGVLLRLKAYCEAT